jgi:hypothetical protein
MVIVSQDDPAATSNRTYHCAHYRQGVGNVFKQEARMGDIEVAPFVVTKRKSKGIAPAKLHETLLSIGAGGFARFSKLLKALLNAENICPSPRGPGHRTRELAEPATYVKNPLTPTKIQLAQRRLV